MLGRDKLSIDYFLLTHFHSDHYGSIRDASGISEHGYRLTGLTEVGDVIPIKTYVDRDYPNYNFPVDLRTNVSGNGGVEPATFQNLLKFLEFQKNNNGMKLEKFEIGSNKQFALKKDPKSYPGLRSEILSRTIFCGLEKARIPLLYLLKKSCWQRMANSMIIRCRPLL